MVLFRQRASDVLYDVLINIEQKKFILPLNICSIVPDTFIKAKKEFIFVDISLEDLCMKRDDILNLLENDSSIDGVLFVKTFGIDLDVENFYKQIKSIRDDIFIVDDMCLSEPQFDCDFKNSYVDLKLFSSGYAKFIDIGYGGYGFLKGSQFCKIFQDDTNIKEFIDYKTEIKKLIPKMVEHKKNLNKIYYDGIDKDLHLGSKYNNWRFSILVDDKDKVLDAIFEDGLFASGHYPQVDKEYVDKPQQNTNTGKIHKHIVNLFNDFRFNDEQAYRVVKIINDLDIKGIK